MIRHLVALKFKPGTSSDTKQTIYKDLSALSARIEGILDFQSCDNVSVEDDLVRGFRDVFWFDFKDETVRDTYLVDDEHKAVGGRLVNELVGGADGVFVIDIKV